MEKEFVPENLVEKLKELGYNGSIIISYMLFGEYKPKVDIIQRITFSQAFRWFREKYGYCHFIRFSGSTQFCSGFEDSGFNEYGFGNYDLYEEAELACLEKLIEIVEGIEDIK